MKFPRKKTKNPPVMSHEFVIQNHADLLSCVAIVIVAGLMTEATSKITKVFIFLQYGLKNDTDTKSSDFETSPNEFERGFLDLFTIFFGALMIAVVHAVIQEYVLDKMCRRLSLSKTKTSKFNESGQLVVWCAVAAAWGGYEIYKVDFFKQLMWLWEGYPHTILTWGQKLYCISQISYWLHLYPELYFLRARKEDIPTRIEYYTLHIVIITAAYIFNFWRIAMVLLTIHYIVEGLFHASRLLYYAEKTEQANLGFSLWRATFLFARPISVALATLTFLYGLNQAENKGLDIAAGNFNTVLIRILSFSTFVLSQIWIIYNYNLLMRRRAKAENQEKQAEKAAAERERAAAAAEQPEPRTRRTPKSKRSKAENTRNGFSAKTSNKLKKN